MSNCNCDLGKMCEVCLNTPPHELMAQALAIPYEVAAKAFKNGVVPPFNKCCDDEDNQYEDDSETHICRGCGEHTCEVKCKICEETVFDSGCCG